MLAELLTASTDATRVWLRAEMDRTVDPMLDSMFQRITNKLINSSIDRTTSTSVQHSTNWAQMDSDESEIDPKILAEVKREIEEEREMQLNMQNDRQMDNRQVEHQVEGEQSSNCLQSDTANHDEAQLQINVSVTNNTQMNIQNDEENVINERSVSERNMEQSTPPTSGVRSSTRKRIQTKVFCNLVQSNVNPRKCGKRKSVQANKCAKQVKRKQILDDDEDTDYDDSDDQEEHTNNAIGEEIFNKSSTNPIQPNLVQPNRHLQCPHCHKSFNRKSTLQNHLRVHTGERSFQCDQCPKRFSQVGHLTTHQQIHQNIKRFRCDQCDKQFTQKVTRDNHLRTHSGERPFQCSFCDKSFTLLDILNKHEQAIHLHVKSYRCKQCGHSATTRSQIITHVRMVHFGLPQSSLV